MAIGPSSSPLHKDTRAFVGGSRPTVYPSTMLGSHSPVAFAE
jgi:hypothetical protein